jgi:hypothetical protein
MPVVELTDQEWGQVMGILGEAPWRVSNPLLMRMGAQLQRQQQTALNKQTNSEEVPINIGENVVKQ